MQDPAATYEMGIRGRERVCRSFSWTISAEVSLQAIERATRDLNQRPQLHRS
jgi:hypothetical protein